MDRRRVRVFRDSFQLKIVRTLISIGIFSLVLLALLGFVVLFWLPAARELELSASGSVLFINLVKIFLIVTVVLLGLIFWISYLISRNLFGPLTRLRKNIERLLKGENPEDIKFRKSDELEFHYISEPFNQLADRMLEIREGVNGLEKDITDVLDKYEKGMIKQKGMVKFVEELKGKITAMKKRRKKGEG
jgi:signal transduction histidine kinase